MLKIELAGKRVLRSTPMQFNIEVQKINHRYIEIKIVRKYPLPLLKLNFTQSRNM